MRLLLMIPVLLFGLALVAYRITAAPPPIRTQAVSFDSFSSNSDKPAPPRRANQAPSFGAPSHAPRTQRSDSPFADDAFAPADAFGATPQQDEAAQLREEYLKIARDKASIMTLEELRASVPKIASELLELRARRELESAMQKLNHVIDAFPESEAASSARKLLRNIETQIEPEPALEPEPKPEPVLPDPQLKS